MKLDWIKYQAPGLEAKYMLVLTLGTTGGKLYCLDADKIDNIDREFLKAKNTYLDALTLQEKIEAIKLLRPSIMRHHKTIRLTNMVILKEYKLT